LKICISRKKRCDQNGGDSWEIGNFKSQFFKTHLKMAILLKNDNFGKFIWHF
jgi:hypothetical protein